MKCNNNILYVCIIIIWLGWLRGYDDEDNDNNRGW